MFDINLGLSIWTIAVFVLLLFILKKFAWGPILGAVQDRDCLLYTSPSPRDGLLSRMPSSA